MSIISNELLRLWEKLYHRAPRVTAVSSFVVAAGLFIVVSIFVESERKRIIEGEFRREQTISYTQQLDALNSVQGSLTNLLTFVEMQKTKRIRRLD